MSGPHADVHGPRFGAPFAEGAARAPHPSHGVQFYRDESYLIESVSRFIRTGLDRGDSVIVIATRQHLDAFRREIPAGDLDPARAIELGRLHLCDARETLAALVGDGVVDEAYFRETIVDMVDSAVRAAPSKRVRAYGEMVDLLWKERRASTMLRLEELWEGLVHDRPMELLCGYDLDAFTGDEHAAALDSVARLHAEPVHSDGFAKLSPQQRLLAFAEEAEKRRSDTELLFRLTEAVNSSLEQEQVYQPALDAVCAALRVQRAAILLFDDDGVMRFKAWRGLSDAYRRAVEGHSPWTRDVKDPQPIFVGDVATDEGLAGYRKVFEAEGIRALGFIPLEAQGQLLGKFMVYAGAPRTFGTRDAQLASTIAAQVGQAVSRAHVLAAERASREKAEQLAAKTAMLQKITASLSTASTIAQVAEAAVLGGETLGAWQSGVWLKDEGGKSAQLLHQRGMTRDRAEMFATMKLDGPRSPVTDAINTREAVWIRSRLEYETRFPEVAIGSGDHEFTLACLPLTSGSRCAGALTYAYRGHRSLTQDDQDFFLVLARHTAVALERARLYDLEKRARSLAEGAQHRSAFLLEASVLLSASLDFQSTLKALARLSVPRIADWCQIELALDASRPSSLLVVEHASPEQASLAYEMRRRYPPDGSSSHGALYVMRTGRAELHEDVPEALLASFARDAEHLRMMREVGHRSVMVVPMIARGRTFGAIAFGIGSDFRRFSAPDLELAELLGRRAAIAIDNALLYEQANAAARAREEVLAVVSHDLRNPLGVVLMSAGNLLRVDPLDEKGAARVKKNAGIIQRSAERMSRLIEDLVDFASMQVGRFTIEPARCAPSEIVTAAVEMFSAMAHAGELSLEVSIAPDLPEVFGDRDRAIQALGNLLSNAVKVTPSGGKIGVSAKRSGDEVVFAVSDTGPGLRAEDLPRLFERYWRSERTSYKGTGLGLTIAKGIVDAHQGRIWAESALGVGSTFRFSIPVAP